MKVARERLSGVRRGVLLVIARRRSCSRPSPWRARLLKSYALAGFAIVAAAAFVAMRPGKERARLAPPLRSPSAPNDPLRALVGGLPDPVIALDRDGRVLALNEPARALAPALRQGEPVSLALRMPELIEAIGRAFAAAKSRVSNIPSACRSTAGSRRS